MNDKHPALNITELSASSVTSVNEIFDYYRPHIDKYIRKHIQPLEIAPRNMIGYHFGWMNRDLEQVDESYGKRFRSSMSLLTYQALEGKFEPCLPVAASIEMIHNFTLIHDDIEDGDEKRRGRPTVWAIWGKPLAINAGDFLHVKCYTVLRDLFVETDNEIKRMFDAQAAIFDTVIELTEGQHSDISFESKEPHEITISEYLSMICGKSASLIECATWVGAMIAPSADEKTIESYKLFGKNIGMSFQIRDDILGIWGRANVTGKPQANDIKKKKKTFAILHGFENASASDLKKLKKIYQKQSLSDDDVFMVLEILSRTNSYKVAQSLADDYYNKAIEHLDSVGINTDPQSNLRRIAEFLGQRDF